MKSRVLRPALIAAAMVLLTGCTGVVMPLGGVTGSGNLETREFQIDEFTRVQAESAVQVQVTRGDAFKVSVEADNNLWDYLRVEKSGSALVVAMKPGYSFFRTTVRATVTMPKLLHLDLSGATTGTVSGFSSTDSFGSDIAGASNLKGDISAGDVTIQISGASRATLTGSAKRLSVEASGASQANLVDLKATDADVQVSGASNATVNVTGKLDASASGASGVRYTGQPTLGRQDVSGASSIRAR